MNTTASPSTSTLLLLCLLAFSCGIGIALHLPFAPQIWSIGGIGVLIAILPLIHRRHICISFIIVISVFALGIARGQSCKHIPSPDRIDWYASEKGQEIILTGTITEEPDIRRDKINYTLRVSEPAQGKVLVSTGKYPSYQYGDTLRVHGRLMHPARFDSFDYAGYLARYGIYSVIYRPSIKRIQRYDPQKADFEQTLMKRLLSVKKSFENAMNQTFATEPTSSFMAGLLLGSRKGMPEQLSEDFRITGLTHIIAISGYNITLIVTILMGLFKPLGRRVSLSLSAIGIILFTLFVGASAAVVRACIMGLIGLLALNSQRKGQITLTLMLTATIMIAYNPLILVHDVGFQLSFLATMGLIYIAPLLERFFLWIPKTLGIRESILLTISAQIMALPVILYNFQNLSLISPLANLLVTGPILPLAMLFGFLGTMTSFLSLTLAKMIAFPAFLLLKYVVTIVHLIAKAPYATIQINWFDQELLSLFFLLLSSSLLWIWRRHHQIMLTISRQQVKVWQDIHHCRHLPCKIAGKRLV